MNQRSRGRRTKPGIIYTFYSYKGGVGRTMALVNIGVLLALTDTSEQRHPRVLMVDWDLEAPGLDTYFELIEASNKTSSYGDRPGIVDLLEAQAKDKILSWRECENKISFAEGDLDYISSGKKNSAEETLPDYGTRVQHLNWSALFEEHDIGNYWNRVRQEWIEEYDYILVDSRTGYTDVGDICTVLLADVLVLCFVTNYQNVRGIDQALKRARQAREALPVDRSRLIAVPVGMRDEIYNEQAKALEWRGIYVRELGYLFKEWLPKSVTPEEAVNQLFIPYVPLNSFGERIPVLENVRERIDPTSIGHAYLRLANLLRTRLDWEASLGGAAVQVSQKALQRAIDSAESEQLRSEKVALEAQLREKEELEAKLRQATVNYATAVAGERDIAQGFIQEMAKRVAGDKALDLDGMKLAVRNAIEIYEREIAGRPVETNLDEIVGPALARAKEQVDRGQSGLARATLRKAAEEIWREENERHERFRRPGCDRASPVRDLRYALATHFFQRQHNATMTGRPPRMQS